MLILFWNLQNQSKVKFNVIDKLILIAIGQFLWFVNNLFSA
jgi:hypothetical protein